MENMQKGMKRKIVLLVGLIAIIVALIVTMIVVKINKQKENFAKANPELAKAKEYDQVQEGEENVDGTDGHVKFDAFFLRDLDGDGNAESIRGTSKEIGKEDTLYMELNVQTAGYLKNAKITMSDGNNFYFQTALPKDNELKDSYVGDNTKVIEFNELKNGTQKLLTGIVRSGDYSYSSRENAAIGNNINNYSKLNTVTLTGTYVGEDGVETPITKTVNFNIDWYGTARASIYTSNSYNTYNDLDDRLDEENETITLNFSIRTEETEDELILKKNHVEATIPQLNGYDPISVEYTGSNATASYNSSTKVLTIDREAQVNEGGTVTSGVSRDNSYSVKVVYPIEAYQSLGENIVTLRIPVSTYYEGYNNATGEFTNPYKSNTPTATILATFGNPKPHVESPSIDITVGKYIYNPSYRYVVSKQKPLRIYNGVSDMEEDDTYQVRWELYTGTNGATSGMVMKETSNDQPQVVDNFVKTDSTNESMEEVTTNVGIGFSGADSVLKEDGWIKVYDEETGDLLVTFTKADWGKYTSSNPYKYELPVKHIRVETSETNAESSLYVYNIKELDDGYITTNYTREEFDNLQYIQSHLVGYLGGNLVGTASHMAHYEAPYSIADIGISNNTISTQITEKNEKITITARNDSSSNQVGWVDGSFVVKLPAEILTAEINSVQINNSAVSLVSYEIVEQDGAKLIKINTKNNNTTPQTYSITIDVDITPDPRVATMSRNIELYASNEETCDYYYKANDVYDVNDNLNIDEQVNHDTVSLSMVSPNSLLTNQIGSNYDDKGSQVVSPEVADIKPVYGIVDQEGEEKEATIGVQVRNNYGSTISDIQILGKIPFEGNTYVISGGDLGSTFTTKMISTGIVVPEELQQYATVYYSEKENPSRDLTDEQNGWKTAEEVTNWDNVKTYLIDLGDYIMPTGKEYVFNYTVKIPNGLEFNKVSFSHHGVFFSLDTDQGKYKTQTEPNKLGFRIAEKYNLELTKYQTGKDKVISGATYSITDEETGESKTAVTNAQGMLTINGLYAEKAYTIKEIKTPSDYELNSDVIRFIGHVDSTTGVLTIEKTSGTTKEDMTVVKEEGQDYKVTLKVEDEVKASIKIHKTEQGTSTPLQNVKYKLTGYGLSENGRTITTNSNGEATIKGLSVNQEYTLQETKAEGYYLAKPITFKIVNNDGNYTVQTIGETSGTGDKQSTGAIVSQSTTEEDSIPTITLNFEDEKIPTYSMQIIKIKKTTDTTLTEDQEEAQEGMAEETDSSNAEVTYLEGAKFKLYKGTDEIGEFTTDGTGTVTIDNLYQYIEGKDEDATYTLKEVLAPEGYAKVKDITFKVDGTDGSLKLINTDGTEENYTIEGNTVKLTIEDSPSFKLIKKDAETGATLAGIKFAIYNVDDGSEQPATNSKGEIIGTKETINGRDYYTVQTDEKGELTADLTEGLYKAVEVQAPEQYDIKNQEYYFGIGASREAPEGMVVTYADSVGGNEESESIYSVASTSDGGIIAGGYFRGTITVGNQQLTNNGNPDGIIIKYDKNGEIEWAKDIGGSSDDYIRSVASTSDGGIIAGGYFNGTIQVGKETLIGNGTDGLIIKYSAEGEVEWVRKIGGISSDQISAVAVTNDGGYIVGGSFESGTIQLGKETLTNNSNIRYGSDYYADGLVVKYSAEGEVEWAKNIGGSSNDYINSIAVTSDGGIIAGGYFYGTTIQVGNETLKSNGNNDGLIIKYNSEGKVEWAKNIGGSSSDQISSVTSTSDGGCVVAEYFIGTIQVGNETFICGSSGSYADSLIIKYDYKGDIQWVKQIKGTDEARITSVTSTYDGGAIVGGWFCKTIQVGKDELSTKGSVDAIIVKYSAYGEVEWKKQFGKSDTRVLSLEAAEDGSLIVGGSFFYTVDIGDYSFTSKMWTDGMIIKYEMKELPNPDVTIAKSIGGSSSDYIQSVARTSDGGYIAGGYFLSRTIQVGNETLRSNGSYDGLIIKYSAEGEVEWAKNIGGSSNDYINSIAVTSDGGYIAGGYFGSNTIQVGDETLTNNGSGYTDGLIIKYNSEGEVEWAKSFGGSDSEHIYSVASTSDGGYIAGGYFGSNTIQVGDETLLSNGGNDGLIIKYNSEGAVEWAKNIGGTSSDYINSVASTSDGGYIAGGYFASDEIQVGNETLTNNSSSTSYSDGLIIKYNSEGEVEWAKSFGGSRDDEIQSVAETTDGGIIVVGDFSGTIQVGNETLDSVNFASDGFIIKYSRKGEVEWAKSFVGVESDYINIAAETFDGGVIAGGYFSGTIQVGNETLTSNGGYDGLIIKYSSEGKVEWAKNIGGSSSDYINSVAETNDGRVIAGGYFQSSTIEVDGHTLTNNGSSDGMILEVVNQVGVPEVEELTVENNRKEFKITTDVNEIDGIKGGSISGEDLTSYEKVKYGDSSTKEIVMTPDENYEIIGITVNGEEWPFTANEDGTYTMPAFENMTEDKHVEVTYSLKDNKIIINKVDSEDNSKKLSGATFKLDQIEERTEPDNEEIIGEIIANGAEYPEADTEKGEVTGVLGDLINNGTYYFVQNEDGTLTPTNSKTYQTAHEGTAGVGNTTANSYIPINLSDKEGEYVVVVNARVSSQSSNDYGYATIKTNTTAPTYSTTTGRFMYISGTVDSKDYTSTTVLEGGNTYYLHLGYRKSSSTDTNEDQVVINSIKVYEKKGVSYNFVDNGEGGYESNNQGQDSTTANSYIPIDLTNYTGKYNLIVNANVSSQTSDYGYATVKSNTTAPAYNSSTGRFIYISGTDDEDTTSTDYTTVLQGGQKYYLHLGYYKNSSTSSGDDKFTVNSVKVTLNDSELYHTEVTTNSEGQAITQIPFGKYQITEITAPEGYELNTEPTIVEFRENGNHEFTIENNKKAQLIVHHYLKTEDGQYTTTKVAEDELQEGMNGEKYTTSPKLDLSDYELEKDEEGKYVIPENAIGTFAPGVTEVTYYYEEKEIPLVVHHYIEGTTEEVPLKDGGVAEDVTDSGKEGESYTTNAIEDSNLSDDYELVETPVNSTGTYNGEEVVVTYYYKKVTRPVVINKYDEDGNSPLAGVTFGISSKYDFNKLSEIADVGELVQNGNYYFEESNGKYISNNQNKNNTTANSYIKIDLTNKSDVTLKINAEVSSQTSDYGYATVTENETAPSYSSSTGRIFRISGQVAAKDYETTLTGGKVYYLHLGYYKNYSTSSYNDTFTINGISLNDMCILGYENLYTTNEKGQIEVTMAPGDYVATETEVPEGYQLPENNTTEFSVTKDQDTVTLDITNTKIKGTVITHHYIEGTETKVPNTEGGVVEDVIQTGNVGDIYATKQADNVNENYEFVSTEGQTSGTIQNGTIEVTYYYKLKPTNVLVHHYIDGTETKVPSKNGGVVEDELIDGQINAPYTTSPSTDIANNYEVVAEKLPENANGNMTLDQIVVTYYYKLKTPTVTNTIEKTGTERITAPDQEMDYTITYNANVIDYVGNAEVTIVDTLPYAIDTSKANDLDGGTYNETDRTITWTENVSDLDSYNGKGTVNITKNIKVFYVGLDMSQDKITNNVKGSIKLLTPETTSDETTDEFDSTIYKSIISAEKMVDKTESQEGEKVTYTVRIKNDGNLAKTVTLADTLPKGLTFDSNTQIKVGNTGTVYTEQNLKNGIQVEVPEFSSVDVVFEGIVDKLPENTYSKELKNKATLDNEPTNEVTTKVTKPNITAHKESDPVSGTKVTEGDTITYRIRVRNDGTREGTVLVKDTIPTGTTFVDYSIKIGDMKDLTKTATDLQNGISVTVGIGEEKVVEFQVRVNKLADGTTIKNTAFINNGVQDEKVPEEPEHTYVEPKEEQEISKTGTSTIDSLDDEITYNINYKATISDYEGNAKIVLVDQLPYAIDEGKSDLDGGTYDEASKTITWEQQVQDIQMTEGKEVTINKQIKVVYTGMSQDTLSIKNVITGHIEYETPERTSDEVTANWTTTTGFIVNIPVSKVWDDSDNKLGQRPTRVVFKLTGSDGSERTLEVAKPGTANTTTTQDSNNPNKWNDMFVDLPKYDSSNNEIVYTLTEEEKTEGDLKYYESSVDNDSQTVTNTNKYGKVTVHHYIMNPDGTTTTNKVPDTNGTEIPDEVIEGKEGDPYTTEPADNLNEKYELVQEKLPENSNGTIEKYDEEKPQEVIYYYRLKPAKVIIHYLEKDEDSEDSNNLVLANDEQIDGHVDDQYNTDTEHRKETIEKDGKTYTLVENSGNTEGTMTVEDTNVTYYYLQNTKATVRYVARDPVTHEEIKDLEPPTTQEGLVGDEFVTNSKEFTGYKLVESPEKTTIKMTKEEQTLIYYYEPVYTGLLENHIDDKTGKILYTEEHEVQVGDSYNIPSKNFEGYDLVTSKLPSNATGTMGEELVTVNYYYIKKAVLEVNYIDKETGEPIVPQIVDDTKHEGDSYTTEQKTFEDYDLVEVPSNAEGTLTVETDENGNITNNKTVVTYYYVRKAVVEEHHIDIVTGEELAEPTIYTGHVGDEYTTSSKEFLSYELVTQDKDGNNMLPENSTGTMTKDKIVVNYYYNQPAKVVVHYVDKTTGKELEENNPETGELQSSQVVIEGQKDDDYTTEAKDFEYYKLVESPEKPDGTMIVEITKDENGNDVVNNTIDVYYYYEPKSFNIGVEKEITAITVNGERRTATNGKLEKVDIYRKSTENTSVQVEYKIKVMNTGEISGRAIIEDKLPEGMSLANNDGTWEVKDGTITKVIPEIGAGETKEYTVLLNWRTSGNNMGNKVNEVSLIQTDNVPGFKDGNDKDNMDEATVSISVETGEFPVGLLIVLVALVGLETVTLRYAVVLTKRQKKNNKNVQKKTNKK